MFLGGVFNAFQLALRGALSDSIPLAATAGGSAGVSEEVSRKDHAHKLLDAYPCITLLSRRAAPLGSVTSSSFGVILPAYLIPANTLGPNDVLMVEAAGGHTASGTNSRTIQYSLGTTNVEANGASITSIATTSASYNGWVICTALCNLSSRSVNKRIQFESWTNGMLTSSGAMNIDFGVDQYLSIMAKDSGNANAVTLNHILIQVQRGTA